MDDGLHDERLRAALRHAPDAAAAPGELLSASILASARRAAEQARRPWWRGTAAGPRRWAWGGAGSLAAAALAATVLFVGREELPTGDRVPAAAPPAPVVLAPQKEEPAVRGEGVGVDRLRDDAAPSASAAVSGTTDRTARSRAAPPADAGPAAARATPVRTPPFAVTAQPAPSPAPSREAPPAAAPPVLADAGRAAPASPVPAVPAPAARREPAPFPGQKHEEEARARASDQVARERDGASNAAAGAAAANGAVGSAAPATAAPQPAGAAATQAGRAPAPPATGTAAAPGLGAAVQQGIGGSRPGALASRQLAARDQARVGTLAAWASRASDEGWRWRARDGSEGPATAAWLSALLSRVGTPSQRAGLPSAADALQLSSSGGTVGSLALLDAQLWVCQADGGSCEVYAAGPAGAAELEAAWRGRPTR